MPQVIYRFYLIWFAIGLVLVTMDWIPSWLEWANSVFLILAGAVAFIYAMATFGPRKGIIISVLIGVTTFSVEGLSAYFDVFFGNYDYTDRFPPLLFGVPIGIGFAWIVMIMAGHALTATISNKVMRVVIASLYVVALDLVLDPVAFVVKEYWIWESDSAYYGIPWTNFAGWFFIAIVWQSILICFKTTKQPELSKQIKIVFWTIVILFTVLAFAAGLYKSLVVTLIAFTLIEGLRRWNYQKK